MHMGGLVIRVIHGKASSSINMDVCRSEEERDALGPLWNDRGRVAIRSVNARLKRMETNQRGSGICTNAFI